ncbi:MAG: DUF3987 domain-containing protein [Prevotella sp.]|nr:DUF3987 domain-containing protein [Prevotella sp.]
MDNKIVFDPLAWASQDNNANRETKNETHTVSAPVVNPAASVPPDGELAKVQAVCEELVQRGANIAESYEDYLKLGFALADGLGEDGRDIYHTLCAQSAKYRQAECEKKWQECLSKHDGRTSIATFYDMAKLAGIDLSAISRRYPSAEFSSNPQKPHGYEANGIQQQKSCDGSSQTADNQNNNNKYPASCPTRVVGADSGEEIEEMRFSFHLTFSQQLDLSKFPVTLLRALEWQKTAVEQDKAILTTLNLLAMAQPNVYGIYGGKRVYTPFYLFILGAAGISQKGAIDDIKELLMPIEKNIQSQYYAQLADYKEQHAEWETRKAQRGRGAESAGPEPEEPVYSTLFVSADSSAAAIKQDLYASGGRGIIFSTEADTLTQALSQEWGQFTDVLRKAFHHETITSTRVKDKQHIVIDEPQLGMLVTCTPKQITDLLSPKQNENGSSSRDLFYCATENLEWRDPFETKEPLGDRYREIGETVKQMYDQLEARKDNRIQILLTEEQQQAFNTHFKPLLPEQVGLYGVDFAAFIVRIALVAFRFMMILTTLRNYEHGHLTDYQQQAFVCTDDDYKTAMTIIDCLVRHTAYVYSTLLRPTDEEHMAILPMKAKEQQLYQALPDVFDTQKFKQTAENIGIPLKSAQRYLGNLISRYQLVERISHGHYAKKQRK